MIWILGGTHEVPLLLGELKSYDDIVVTVTTDEAREFLPKDLKVRVGSMTEDEKLAFVKENDINLIVDMTHPFARHIKKSIADFSKKYNIDFVRFNRKVASFSDDDIIYVKSYDEAEEFVSSHTGTYFFTTGVNECERFLRVKNGSRMIFRILPSVKSIEKISALGVPMKDICAMLGPFDEELNTALINTYGADYLVTKNSGEGSGTKEKLLAAKKAGIKVVMIEAEEENGIQSMDELIKLLGEY